MNMVTQQILQKLSSLSISLNFILDKLDFSLSAAPLTDVEDACSKTFFSLLMYLHVHTVHGLPDFFNQSTVSS